MTVNPRDIYKLLDAIDHHHRSALAKSTELRAYISALNLKAPSDHTCPKCKIHHAARHLLDEHMYHAHNGPEPAHWLEAEARTENADDIPEIETAPITAKPAAPPENPSNRHHRRRFLSGAAE